MQEQVSNSIFYTLGLYDIWNLLDNQQKETLTEAINIGINEGLKANPVENRTDKPEIAEEKYRVSNWIDGWRWFGSYKDYEDGELLLYVCSNKCRGSMTEDATINLLKLKRKAMQKFINERY